MLFCKCYFLLKTNKHSIFKKKCYWCDFLLLLLFNTHRHFCSVLSIQIPLYVFGFSVCVRACVRVCVCGHMMETAGVFWIRLRQIGEAACCYLAGVQLYLCLAF